MRATRPKPLTLTDPVPVYFEGDAIEHKDALSEGLRQLQSLHGVQIGHHLPLSSSISIIDEKGKQLVQNLQACRPVAPAEPTTSARPSSSRGRTKKKQSTDGDDSRIQLPKVQKIGDFQQNTAALSSVCGPESAPASADGEYFQYQQRQNGGSHAAPSYDLEDEDEAWLERYNAQVPKDSRIDDTMLEAALEALELAHFTFLKAHLLAAASTSTAPPAVPLPSSFPSPADVLIEREAARVLQLLVPPAAVTSMYQHWMQRRQQQHLQGPLLQHLWLEFPWKAHVGVSGGMEGGVFADNEEEGGRRQRLTQGVAWAHMMTIRQDLERVRTLADQMRKRERFKRQLMLLWKQIWLLKLQEARQQQGQRQQLGQAAKKASGKGRAVAVADKGKEAVVEGKGRAASVQHKGKEAVVEGKGRAAPVQSNGRKRAVKGKGKQVVVEGNGREVAVDDALATRSTVQQHRQLRQERGKTTLVPVAGRGEKGSKAHEQHVELQGDIGVREGTVRSRGGESRKNGKDKGQGVGQRLQSTVSEEGTGGACHEQEHGSDGYGREVMVIGSGAGQRVTRHRKQVYDQQERWEQQQLPQQGHQQPKNQRPPGKKEQLAPTEAVTQLPQKEQEGGAGATRGAGEERVGSNRGMKGTRDAKAATGRDEQKIMSRKRSEEGESTDAVMQSSEGRGQGSKGSKQALEGPEAVDGSGPGIEGVHVTRGSSWLELLPQQPVVGQVGEEQKFTRGKSRGQQQQKRHHESEAEADVGLGLKAAAGRHITRQQGQKGKEDDGGEEVVLVAGHCQDKQHKQRLNGPGGEELVGVSATARRITRQQGQEADDGDVGRDRLTAGLAAQRKSSRHKQGGQEERLHQKHQEVEVGDTSNQLDGMLSPRQARTAQRLLREQQAQLDIRNKQRHQQQVQQGKEKAEGESQQQQQQPQGAAAVRSKARFTFQLPMAGVSPAHLRDHRARAAHSAPAIPVVGSTRNSQAHRLSRRLQEADENLRGAHDPAVENLPGLPNGLKGASVAAHNGGHSPVLTRLRNHKRPSVAMSRPLPHTAHSKPCIALPAALHSASGASDSLPTAKHSKNAEHTTPALSRVSATVPSVPAIPAVPQVGRAAAVKRTLTTADVSAVQPVAKRARRDQNMALQVKGSSLAASPRVTRQSFSHHQQGGAGGQLPAQHTTRPQAQLDAAAGLAGDQPASTVLMELQVQPQVPAPAAKKHKQLQHASVLRRSHRPAVAAALQVFPLLPI